jgi:hypothetical protein
MSEFVSDINRIISENRDKEITEVVDLVLVFFHEHHPDVSQTTIQDAVLEAMANNATETNNDR